MNVKLTWTGGLVAKAMEHLNCSIPKAIEFVESAVQEKIDRTSQEPFCSVCAGSGENSLNGEDCDECDGKGFFEETKEVKSTNPAYNPNEKFCL